ncbi:MAG: hypothetical protein PHG20_05380 [Geobacteraceae bacterium]|nr:hypothetical protein [Geobacteraceae bacterium]
MTRAKLAIAMAAVLALLAGTVEVSPAQPGPGAKWGQGKRHHKARMHQMGPGAHLDMITARLSLTDEQRIKILPILDEQFAKKREVFKDGSLTRDQRRAKMQEISDTYHERITAVLTPEQKEKADKMKEYAAKRAKARKDGKTGRYERGMRAMDPAARLEWMSTNLGLTADQKAKISPIMEEQAKEMKAVRDDAKLTRDQRMTKMQELRVKHQEKIGEVLTPEQKSKFQTQCPWGNKGMGRGHMMHGGRPAPPPAK